MWSFLYPVVPAPIPYDEMQLLKSSSTLQQRGPGALYAQRERQDDEKTDDLPTLKPNLC